MRSLFGDALRASILPLAALAASTLAVGPAAADTLFPFTAVLNGAQETPPVDSPSTGVAFLTLNKDTSELCYAISYTPLGGDELVAHFHGPTPPGLPGPVIHFITPGPSPLGSPKHGCVTLTGTQPKELKKGLIYINVHSSIAVAGEIRGQVLPVKGVKYANVPATSTTTTTVTTTTSTTIGSPSGAFLD